MTTIPIPVAIFLILTVSMATAQTLLGTAFLLRSRGILETDKIFAVAGRYLLGFGATTLLTFAAVSAWVIISAAR